MSFHRVLRPPGGGSSNLFGAFEEDMSTSRRQNKMSSSIFGPPEETRGSPKCSNPPGESFCVQVPSADTMFHCPHVSLGCLAPSK